MKILIIGSGGREHALAWKLKQSPRVSEIFCTSGNAGIAQIAEVVKLEDGSITGMADFAQTIGADLTIIGPEAPLVAGIVDEFEVRGLRVFGPSKAAAQLEGSKAFAKAFMERHSIPTAEYRVFEDLVEAREYIHSADIPLVVKADGVAAGKGVFVTETHDEALSALETIMEERAFGEAGNKVIIEEKLQGEEATLLAFSDGYTVVPMVSSQDHKAVYDGDEGPNTGGMGAYSPAPVVTPELLDKVMEDILIPVVEGMREEGRLYKGVLYAGLMIKDGQPKVLEFNARFGDPEAQVVLPRLETDLVDVMEAVISGKLHEIELKWSEDVALCVILASGGYPGSYETGKVISGLEDISGLPWLTAFHSGTSSKDGRILTSGGRVLGLTALGEDINQAIERAYEAVGKVGFQGMHFRKDIGKKALTHL